MSERHIEDIHPLPYEPMAEQLAIEKVRHIEHTYGNDPHVIVANLPIILQEYGHDCLELGMGIADHFPNAGAVEILEAYNAGVQQGKRERGE